MPAPWEESYDKPRQHIKKQRHYFANEVHIVKATVFPVLMYGFKSWTIKKAKWHRINVFKLWCWRRLLKVPQTARRSSQSILKEINSEYSLEGKAESPVLWLPDGKSQLIGKDPDAEKD